MRWWSSNPDGPPARARGAAQRLGVTTVALAAVVAAAACRRDMQDQPKYKPFRASRVFADGASARPLVEGTVPRGELRADSHLYTGKVNNQPVDTFPFPVTRAVLDRGQERFEIFCTPCHGRTGDGDGMVVRRGYRRPPTWHSDRLRGMPVGYFFDVITNGFGAMPDYKAQIPVADRWAIVAYIRALQLAQHAPVAELPPADREALERAPAAAARTEEAHR
jgi:mono/diheme cytochrome c family protein